MAGRTPLVSFVMPARDAAPLVAQAVASVLRQTVADLELVVVDDGSRDATAELLAAVDDPRLVVVSHEEGRGVAAALNAGLDRATGTYVARLDADDVALPRRLERQLARLRSAPPVKIVGSAVVEVDERGRLGRVHEMPVGVAAVRWRSLFSTPFWHPTVVVERDLLELGPLRYDTSFDAGDAAEDYDLWTRLLGLADGDNLAEPLVLYRRHPAQVSERRQERQGSARRRIGVREIESAAPELGPEAAQLAWAVGAGEPLPTGRERDATDAFLALLERFSERHRGVDLRAVRAAAAKEVARLASRSGELRLLRQALALSPTLPATVAAGRVRRRSAGRAVTGDAPRFAPAGPVRVTVVSPEPTPYRAPLFDRVAARPEVDLTVIYAARTVVGRTWTVEPEHRSVFLRGLRLPGVRRLLHHDYPVTPGIWGALGESRPDCVVVSGWSTFAAQAAILWCRLRHVPFALIVESHDEGPRAGWRRAVKGAVVPRIVGRACGALVTGTLARESMLARGAPPEHVRVFANTVDVAAWGEEADRLAARRPELRAKLGLGEDDVAVLSVARLAPEKGHGTLLRAAARDARLVVILAGDGPERGRLERLAGELGVRLVLAGDLPHEGVVEAYAAADVFALLSDREPWAVVVNEAAACGLPLVLSDRVGAAFDLLEDGHNGELVPAGDVAAAAAALTRLADDPGARRLAGARSRHIAQAWGYEPSVESFVAAVGVACGP